MLLESAAKIIFTDEKSLRNLVKTHITGDILIEISDNSCSKLALGVCHVLAVSGKEKATPAGLQSVIAGHLKTRDVVVVCSGRKQELETPRFAGKQYVIGKYRLFHYYKNGVKR